MSRFLAAGILLAVSVTSAYGQALRRAPGFALPDLNINYHDIADYRGKVVLLDFVQTTCPICQTSQKIYERIRAKYPDKVAVIAVVVPPDTQETVRMFIQQWSIKTPVLFDCGQVMGSYTRVTPKNPTVTFPRLFIVDQNGMIRKDFEYKTGTEHIFEKLDPLMNEVEALLTASPAKAGPAKPAPKK